MTEIVRTVLHCLYLCHAIGLTFILTSKYLANKILDTIFI